MLNDGDLPIDGNLKHVVLKRKELSSISGSSIPNGVEIVEYYNCTSEKQLSDNETTKLSELPSSVHTVKNVVIFEAISNSYEIPSNIKSITFESFFNISGRRNIDGLILPNTLRKLSFNKSNGLYNNDNDDSLVMNNKEIKLKFSDIPEGLTSLSIPYDKFEIYNNILPSSIKKLIIHSLIFQDKEEDDYFESIPSNVKLLKFYQCFNFLKSSNLYKCKSIKTLSIEFKIIDFFNFHESHYYGPLYKCGKIGENSLPSSITKLSISNIAKPDCININSIPIGVKKLKLYHQLSSIRNNIFYIDEVILANVIDQCSTLIPNTVVELTINKMIVQEGVFPLTSLKTLHYDGRDKYSISKGFGFSHHEIYCFEKMISILPKSLTSITIPIDFKKYNFIFPSNINVQFKK